jgi:hypothetical protein
MWLRFSLFLESLPVDLLRGIALVLLAFLLLYLPIGMIWVNEIDDNLEPTVVNQTEPGQSAAVNAAIYLIDRETREHNWTPNDPIFLPGAWLDRMPAFQAGIVSALSRFAIEMSDQIGRTRGSSQMDSDLDRAAGLLKYPPDIWIFDFSTSLIPTASSHKQYRRAAKAFENYNTRLGLGEAVFERRADNLQNTLERIAADVGSASAALANRIDKAPLIDSDADVLYYDVKGRMYAYYIILHALRKDYANVIAEKQLGPAWDLLENSLAHAAKLDNFFIFNNAPDSQFMPNHLTAMGFYVLRARTQLKEISNILLK